MWLYTLKFKMSIPECRPNLKNADFIKNNANLIYALSKIPPDSLQNITVFLTCLKHMH